MFPFGSRCACCVQLGPLGDLCNMRQVLPWHFWRLWCKKGIYGQFYILDITFRGQMFGNKTFSYILLFKTWTSIHHLVKKTMISFSKAVKYFCFKLRYGQYKTRVSRQRWLDQCHQINEDLDFHKHHLLALSTYVQNCRLTRFNALYELGYLKVSNAEAHSVDTGIS